MSIKQIYDVILNKIWIEVPLYYFNLGKSIRFELHDKSPNDDSKIYKFLEEIYDYIFGSSNVIYLIQITDANISCRQSIRKMFNINKKPDMYYFRTRNTSDWEENQLARIYEVSTNSIDKKMLLEFIYSGNVDAHLFILDPISLSILNIYDERGMDISSLNKNLLIDVFNKFSDWVLDYDRPDIVKSLFDTKAELVEMPENKKCNNSNSSTKFPVVTSFEAKNLDGYEVDNNTMLRSLILGDNTGKINYIKLTQFVELKELKIHYAKPFDIDKISPLKKLTHLELSYCKINNLGDIAKLGNLNSLTIKYDRSIVSLKGLANSKSIKKLYIEGCSRLEELSEIGNIEQLEYLRIDGIKNKDLSFISKLKKLKVLELMDCGKINSIKFINAMPEIEAVYIFKSNIIDGDLTPLKRLKHVDVYDRRHYNMKRDDFTY